MLKTKLTSPMKRVVAAFFMVILLLPVFPIRAHADIGPKPSVVIDFEGLEQEEYYVTLLSDRPSTGPWSEGNPYYDYMGDKGVFDKFASYEDPDGYYFLSYMEDCSETDQFSWTYYPPDQFKVLIYYVDRDEFQVSDQIYEKYAFDSYFLAEFEKEDGIGRGSSFSLKNNYNYTGEILSLIVRIVITIILELMIAYLFGYRDRKNIRVIMVTNLATQIILNVVLNLSQYYSGYYALLLAYFCLEILVMVIEGSVYKRHTDAIDAVSGKKMHPVIYAIVANGASWWIGVWLAKVIPNMF